MKIETIQPVHRILSIDGGGIKGVFPASFLATVEDAIGDRVSHYFDLIVGTSTGGIIALGLGLGLSATEILTLYESLGPTVFKDRSFIATLRHLFFSKYDNTSLRSTLESKFGERTLGESTKRLVIPAINLETGEAYLYKTPHHPKFERDHKQSAVTVAMATSAAPSYFPSHKANTGLALLDGGMWANNPVSVAIIEAIAVLKWDPKSLRVLSLGCTTTPSNLGRARWLPLGKLYWARKAIEVIMAGQSSSALGTAKLFVGEENVFRINPSTAKGRFGLDKAEEIPSLKGLGDAEARKALTKLRQVFFTNHAPTFQPYHSRKDNPCQTIGTREILLVNN